MARIALALLSSLALLGASSALWEGGPQIDPRVESVLSGASLVGVNIFITMRAGTEHVLKEVRMSTFATTALKRTALYSALRRNAEESQAPLLELLVPHSGEVKSYWISNQISIRGADSRVLELLRGRSDVSRVDLEAQAQLDEPVSLQVLPGTHTSRAVDWNLDIIRLPSVWAAGVNGTGIVVGNIDTGVRSTHEALRGSYKNDAYSWFDPVTGSSAPVDDHTHGTLTMGLLAGGMETGVAYGAKWIACKGLNAQGVADQGDLLSCGQFILCPTHPDGKEPDCTQAPHVISNSWNSVDPNANFFLPVINAWREGGIVPVWSAGNYGERGCASLGSHAPYSVIAVGSTGSTDRLSYFSSQGPSPQDDKVIKPEVVAPGETIRSAHNQADNTYAQASGTSMAAPHVAGVAALILSTDPSYTFEEVKAVLESTAATNLGFAGAVCNGQPDSLFPNYQFGHGRLDAWAAYECVRDGGACHMDPTPTTSTTTESPTTITLVPVDPTTTTTARPILPLP